MAKIFVSYSRKDKVVARKIILALKDMGQDVWVDWEDIPPASDWMDQIKKGIEGVDAFIFLVSQESIASGYCTDEINYAEKNKKRIIPVAIQNVKPEATIDIIRKLNWIFMWEENKFKEGIQAIKTAIEYDFEWVEEHSDLQARALKWHREKDASLLLRGRNLWTARQMFAKAEKKDPAPTDLQRTYIEYSNRNERRFLIISALAFVTIAALAILSYTALIQSDLATRNANEANIQREKAEANAQEAQVNAEKANANALEANKAQKEAEAAKEEEQAARQKAEENEKIAAAQRSAARAQIYQFRPGELYTSTLLAIDSWQSIPSTEAEEILRENISLLPIPVNQMTHAGKINSLEFSPTGDTFITAGADGATCAWQVSDGKNIFCTDSPAAVNDAVFSPKTGALIATGDDKGNVQIINASDGSVRNTFSFKASIRNVDIRFDERFLAVTSDDGKITLIDLTTNKKSFDLEASDITTASFSPNGLVIAAGSKSGVITFWYLNDKNKIINTRKHRGEVLTIKFSPNGKYLVSGSVDGSAVLMDTATGEEKFRCAHQDQVKGIAFSSNGAWFVTVSNDRKIRVWNTDDGTQRLLMEQNDFVQAVKVSANDQWITTTGDDKTVRVWNASTGTEIFQVPLKAKGSALGFSKDGKYLTSGDTSGAINIWDISAIPSPVNYLQFKGVTGSAGFSPAGNLIAASDDKRVWLLTPPAGQSTTPTTRPQGSPILELKSNISKIVFSPDSKWLAISTVGNEIVIYNTQTKSNKSIPASGIIQAFVFSPDGKKLFISGANNKVDAWDMATGKFSNTVFEGAKATSLAVSTTFLAIGTENKIIILDINTGLEVEQLEALGSHDLLAFNTDGSILASSHTSGEIHIWAQENGKFVQQHVIVKQPAFSMSFNPIDNRLAVGTTNNVYLIDPLAGEETTRIPITGAVNGVSFSTDGKTLATASLKVIQFWDLSKIHEIKNSNLTETACTHLVENFNSAQWNTLFNAGRYHPICENLPVP